ncbi:MAG: hypothetical protein NUV67_00470 [archaeon]|nr:hypothetical protein [archaeon]
MPQAKNEAGQDKELKVENERQRLLDRSKVSLIIDHYDDIFSDFDSRPYSHRSLSDDFLIEAKKVARDTSEGIAEIRFMVPQVARNIGNEAVIKKRLKAHFKKHAEMLSQEIGSAKKEGMIFASGGFVMMVIAALISINEFGGIFFVILSVLLEPAGWFTVWFGLDSIFYAQRDKYVELDFYRKLGKTEIIFEPF